MYTNTSCYRTTLHVYVLPEILFFVDSELDYSVSMHRVGRYHCMYWKLKKLHSYKIGPYENNVYLSKLKANFSPLKFTFWP